MSYEDLKKYVDEQKEAGVPNEEIRHALKEKEWAPELIDKVLKDEEEKDEPKIPTIKELLVNTWNTFTNDAARYIVSYLVSIGITLLSLVILASPIIYDVTVLKLNIQDMTGGSMAPLFISYFVISFIIIFFAATFGQLLQTYIASFKDMDIKEAMKKSWKSLPSYIWLNILVTLFLMSIAIPSLIVFGLAASNLIPKSFTFVALGTGFLLLIPMFYFAITMIFAVFAFVVHGAKGKTAIRASYNIVKNKFKWIFVRIFVLWIVLVIVNAISQIVPFIGFIINVVISPLSIIYFFKLYKSAEYQYQKRDELA